MESRELIIIGSGPAGLKAGEEAKKKGIDYLILEQGEIGHSWGSIRPEMPMLSPCHPQRDWTSLSSDFPIWKMEVTRPFCYAKEFVQYLQHFSDFFDLKIKTQTTVKSVHKKNKEFELITENNKYIAPIVYACTGFFGNPYIPDIPGLKSSPIVTHSHFFKSKLPFKHKRVLIIGGGNSGAEIALVLSGEAQVYLLIRGILKFFSQTKNLCDIRGISESFLLEQINMGIIRYFSRVNIKKVDEDLIYFDDKILKAQAIICATGYRPVLEPYSNLPVKVQERTKFPKINAHGEASEIQNLFFGGPLAYTGLSKLFIHGFIKSIPATINKIENRLMKKGVKQ